MAGNSIQFEPQETGPMPEAQDFSGDPNRPEWLPQNFKTVEDFVSSYQETKGTLTKAQQELAALKGQPEGEFGQQQQEAPPENPEAKPDDQQAPPQDDQLDDAARELADKAGLDLTPYQEEYMSQGDVSPEHRAEIAEGLKGLLGEQSRAIVDQFIDTRKVTQQNDMNLYMNTAGGADRYAEMVQWASQNMDQGQITAFNKQVNSGDRSSVLFAIESLKTRYEAANGRSPSLLQGRSPAHSGVRPFRSAAEMTTAMADPRYKTDPAYREEVRNRIAASD